MSEYVSVNLENFDYEALGLPASSRQIAKFVHDNPFEHTLTEIGAEFAVDPEVVRQVLHSTGEFLTAIPVQEGLRHVWGYSDAAGEEWEYLRRRMGMAASSILSCHARMARVREKYGAPKTPAQLEVAAVLLDLFMALPDETLQETPNV